jgi:hypothetical protein
MSDTLERMLRIILMNQVEIMTALEELLSPEALTEDEHADRAEIRANLDEAIEQTVESLKDLGRSAPGGKGDQGGHA